MKARFLVPILGLIGGLLVLYCILCQVIAGTIGLPIQMQKTVSYEQKSLYNNLSDFEIRKDVIFSSSDQGVISLQIDNNPVGKYRFVTIITSALSDFETIAEVRYGNGEGDFPEENLRHFMLNRGQSQAHIAYNNWSELRIRLGTRDGMSMVVDRVMLSRFPILPENFLMIFLALCAILCVIWYLITFHGLGKYLLKRPTALLAVIILFQVLTVVNLIDQKKGFHVDEIYSLTQANGTQGVAWPRSDVNWYNTWNDSEYYWNTITVQPEERFNYKYVYDVMIQNVHPPLYNLLLHTVYSFNPNKLNNWYGAWINIFWFVLANISLYLSSRLILKSKYLALLPSIIWGFSAGLLTSMTFFRPYVMLTFFFTALTYLSLLLISGKRKADRRFCITFAAVLVLGFFTQLYFIIYFTLIAIGLLVWLLYKKEHKQLLNCTIATACGAGIYFAIWPYAISQMFSSSRGEQTMESLLAKESFNNNISVYYGFLDIKLFGGTLAVFAIIAAELVIIHLVLWAKRKGGLKIVFETDKYIVIFLLFIVVGYLFFIIQAAPELGERYIFAIYPVCILVFISFFYQVFKLISIKCSALAIICISICIFSLSYRDKPVDAYLYEANPDVPEIVSSFENSACIVVGIAGGRGAVIRGRLDRFIPDFISFDKTYVCRTQDDFLTALEGISNKQDLFIYALAGIEAEDLFSEMKEKFPCKNIVLAYEHISYTVYRVELER